MTTQKVQSKIKTSTIAITVLSILLAVAVASTIVLAAFSANKQASSTITFGGGLTIQVTNTTMDAQARWKVNSVNTAGTVGDDITGSTGALTNGAQFAAFSVKNTSSAPIAIAFKLERTSGTAALYVDKNGVNETETLSASNYNASGVASTITSYEDWFIISSVNANDTADLTKAINTVYSAEKIAALEGGDTATLNIKIAAVFAGTDANSLLATALANGNWADITAGEVATA